MDFDSDELCRGLLLTMGFNPKDDPETTGLAILILRQVLSTSLCQGTPRVVFERKLGKSKIKTHFLQSHACIN